MPAHPISKTSFLSGCQCPKLLWKRLNEPDAFPAVDEARQALFDQGHAVGELAKSLYPGGIEVGEGVVHRRSAAEETASVLARGVPLYEPAFIFGDGYARIDILVPDGPGTWRIVEVKSGASVKEENLLDVAFQLHVCRGAGLTITRCALMHVDTGYVRQGGIDASELLAEKDVTEEVLNLLPTIPARLAGLAAAAAQPSCPAVAIGPHCNRPYSCDLQPQCWAFLPDYPVTDLSGDRRGRRWDYLARGVHGLADIPDPGVLNARQQIQIETARSGQPHLDPAALQGFLESLKWPLAFFDIETTSSAVPFYDGTRPYQQIPFQFSLHIHEQPDGPLVHHQFLAEGTDDPRPRFLEELRACLPPDGTVVVYNATFENRCLRDCATAFPGHAWAAEIPDRTVDLLLPFRAFSYHHRDQHGSASIKDVLPALTGTDYSHLAIRDGNAAARAFAAAEFTDLSAEVRSRLRRDLLAYCKLDTRAMIDLVKALRQITRSSSS